MKVPEVHVGEWWVVGFSDNFTDMEPVTRYATAEIVEDIFTHELCVLSTVFHHSDAKPLSCVTEWVRRIELPVVW